MPDRLSDIVNVKDWGAVGNINNDDRPAIQAAIDYCISRGGGKVFFPPGGYGLGGGFLSVGSSNPDASVELIGAGRNYYVEIVGNYSGFLISKGSGTYDNLQRIEGMGITNGGGPCVKVTRECVGIHNCIFRGSVKVDASAANGCTIQDCAASGGENLTEACGNHPFPTSVVGFYLGNRCVAINCRLMGGMWIAYALSGTGAAVISCSTETNTIAVRLGWSPTGEKPAIACLVQGLGTERCDTGIELYNCQGCLIQGNALTAASGTPAPYSAIDNMTWSNGTAYVTTHLPHNIAADQKIQLDIGMGINPVPGSWKPQYFQDAHITGPSTFTYPLANDPGAFRPGSAWNYPPKYAIRCRVVSETVISANSLGGVAASVASCDLDYGGQAQHKNNVFVNSSGSKAGWLLPSTGTYGSKSLAGWYFSQVGSSGVEINSVCQTPNPLGAMHFSDLPGQPNVPQDGPIEGQEYIIIDSPTAASGNFGANVTVGGGNNHVKVRYNSGTAHWTICG